jgi:hypothetical protein
MNGDTYPDLVWRHAVTGSDVVWFLKGTTLVSQSTFEAVSDVQWKIVAIGDINGDTKPDLIWRHTGTGLNVVWYMDGLARIGQGSLPTIADLNWSIVP